MLVGAEKQILSWIQQMKQTPAKQDPSKRPVNRAVPVKPAETEEKPAELEPWAQLVEHLGTTGKDSRLAVASELQVVSDKLEGNKQQPFDISKYLPREVATVKTEKPPSPPQPGAAAKPATNSPMGGFSVIASLVPPLPGQKWETTSIVSKQGMEISLAPDSLAKKRRITKNSSLPIPKTMARPAGYAASQDIVYSLKEANEQLSLIVEPTIKQFTKEALLEVQPDLEPLPEIAPEWDGLDEFGADLRACAHAEDAVVPVKSESGVKGPVEGHKRKHEEEPSLVRVLQTYQKFLARWKAIKSEVDALEKEGFRFSAIPNHLGTTFYLKAVPRLSPSPPPSSSSLSSSSSSLSSSSSSSRSSSSSSPTPFPSPAFYLYVPRFGNEPIKYAFSTELQSILEATKRENPHAAPVPATHTNNSLPPTAETHFSAGSIPCATDRARETSRDSLRGMVRRFEAQLAQVASPLTITSLGRTWAEGVNAVRVAS
jgi:hypothetical protein